MNNLINWLKGKKTYTVAIIAVVYALSSVATGNMSWQQAVAWFLGSGAISSLRSAIADVQVWLPYLEGVIHSLTPPAPSLPQGTTNLGTVTATTTAEPPATTNPNA
jgi:hypothetical protein